VVGMVQAWIHRVLLPFIPVLQKSYQHSSPLICSLPSQVPGGWKAARVKDALVSAISSSFQWSSSAQRTKTQKRKEQEYFGSCAARDRDRKKALPMLLSK
jgi:hypothetical protein